MSKKKETPFVFGHLADNQEFTNRTDELKRLMTCFRSSINVTLISPRRWGKSSLIKAASIKAKRTDPKLKFCFIDLYSIRYEEEFYQELAQQVIKSTSSKFKEWITEAKRYIPSAIPKVTFETPTGEFELGLNWKDRITTTREILELPEKICKAKNIRMVICIDEFQNISALEDPLGFQKLLRSHWQHHNFTGYCIYGSKRHMMMDIFASPSMPFYKFGELMFLDKISEKDWVKFIQKRFKDTGKSILAEDALHLCQLVDRHSYYVQQLAQQVWLRTPKKCLRAYVDDAHDSLARQLSMLFQEKTDQLSSPQLGFIEALIDQVEQYSAKSTIDDYRLGSSANVQQIKKALLNKEIIDIHSKKIEMLDPLYKFWLMRYYFKKKI